VTTSLGAWRVAAAAWAGAILVTGMLPTQGAVEVISGGRDDLATTAGHFAAYTLLGFLLGVALGGWRVKRDRVVLALALATALGGLIELAQLPLPYREGQLVDVVVNAAGAAAGLAVFSAVALARRPRSRPG
jgi:VanZ family protein